MRLWPRDYALVARRNPSCSSRILEPRVLLACADLTSIDLPDTEIRYAREIGSNPRYCRVLGRIEETINFEVRMPANPEWNGKFLMFGNGGFAGSIPMEIATDTSALQKGYAVAGRTPVIKEQCKPSWALNNLKAQEDYAYRAVHLTAATTRQIIQFHYGSNVVHSYFVGALTAGDKE